ncbi:MAG: hypothetical protein ACOYNI_00365 [Acidimicrobiia bacterium]
MSVALVLASELTKKSLWNPTLLGWLVFVSAIVLFFGAIYLLLATNLGSRLGFLVAGAGIFGLMVLMTAMWSTTAYPLNTLRGALSGWKPVEVTKNAGDAPTVTAVKNAPTEEKNLFLSETLRPEYANIAAAAGDALVIKPVIAGEPAPLTRWQERNPPEFQSNEAPVIGAVFEVTESNTWPQKDTRWALVEFCPAKEGTPALGETPSKCNPSAVRYLVLKYDYGSLRVPPIVAFVFSLIGFALFVLGLHWRERDEKAAKRAAEAADADATSATTGANA